MANDRDSAVRRSDDYRAPIGHSRFTACPTELAVLRLELSCHFLREPPAAMWRRAIPTGRQPTETCPRASEPFPSSTPRQPLQAGPAEVAGEIGTVRCSSRSTAPSGRDQRKDASRPASKMRFLSMRKHRSAARVAAGASRAPRASSRDRSRTELYARPPRRMTDGSAAHPRRNLARRLRRRP